MDSILINVQRLTVIHFRDFNINLCELKIANAFNQSINNIVCKRMTCIILHACTVMYSIAGLVYMSYSLQ